MDCTSCLVITKLDIITDAVSLYFQDFIFFLHWGPTLDYRFAFEDFKTCTKGQQLPTAAQ